MISLANRLLSSHSSSPPQPVYKHVNCRLCYIVSLNITIYMIAVQNTTGTSAGLMLRALLYKNAAGWPFVLHVLLPPAAHKPGCDIAGHHNTLSASLLHCCHCCTHPVFITASSLFVKAAAALPPTCIYFVWSSGAATTNICQYMSNEYINTYTSPSSSSCS